MKNIFAIALAAAALSASAQDAQFEWSNLAVPTDFATTFPSGAQMGGTAVLSVNGADYLYFVGPNSGGDRLNIYYVDVTDPSSPGTWQSSTFTSPSNSLVYTTNSVVPYNGRLYVVAGSFNSGNTPIDYNGIRVFTPDANGDIADIDQEYDGSVGEPDIQGFASSAAVDPDTGILYILAAGVTSQTAIQRVQIDAGTGEITGTPSLAGTLPSPRRQAPMVIYNDTLYVVGGWNSEASAAADTVYYATIQPGGDLSAFAATTAPLPQAVSDMGAVVFQDRLYVTGGTTANSNATAVDDVFSADLTAGADISEWATEADLAFANGGVRRINAAVSSQGVFVVGGRQPDGVVNGAVHFGQIAVPPTNASRWELYVD